ncbi:Zn-dependent amino-or carboxypeptidase, M28 family [Chitinophaga eiseniae]|uniref:Zn-dependent amino-or carboxypeptidase, M28 family n=2 Tax=Chitinophaga eiseniae TaxID=634771 RepID=A0A1T4RU44_9BACT|nr:Zn-dependent amino-or carboxypeptidase, M28 family [Chitinophaga eiseniae]
MKVRLFFYRPVSGFTKKQFMRLLVTAVCLFSLSTVFAQGKSPLVFDKATALRYGATITPASTKAQLAVIAGEEMEGRETGTRGQERAAAYIVSQFKEAGLQPGANGQWEQHYPLYRDSLETGTITVGDRTFQFGTDFYSNVQETLNSTVEAGVVFAGYGVVTPERNDYKGLDVKGKIVMVREGVPAGVAREKASPSEKAAVAAFRGAAAVLVISRSANRFRLLNQDYLRRTDIYKFRDTSSRPGVYYITPAMAGAMMGRDSLQAEQGLLPVTSLQPVQIRFAKKDLTLWPSNVLGYLEGTDKKDEVVFITAHYDHLGIVDGKINYGADDDGSGTAAVIEMAKAFGKAAREGRRPRRSIVFMTVSGEEKGLLGSAYYTANPVYPLAKTVVDLNIDMIGRIDPEHEHDPNYIYIIGDDKISSELRPLSESVNDAYTRFTLDYKFNDPNDPHQFYSRSDHYNFARHGIPVIFYFNGTHADYHQPTDTVEKINYELLSRRAQLVFYTAWQIAMTATKL